MKIYKSEIKKFPFPRSIKTIDALANPFGDEAIEVTPMVEMGLGWGPTPVAYNRRHTFRSSYYDWGYGNPGYSDADFLGEQNTKSYIWKG